MARRRIEDPERQVRLAALDLIAQHGLDGVTVAEIAAAAGVSERTFFRYFADKQEAIFRGGEQLQQQILDGLAASPATEPLLAVRDAFLAAAGFFPGDRRAHSRQRSGVIAADPRLRERELTKLDGISAALTAALLTRGIDPAAAALAADMGTAAFRRAHLAWIDDGETRSMDELLRDRFATLVALAEVTAPR